jgi:hypothetical protein
MDNFKAYGNWYRMLTQWRPDESPSRVRNLALLIVGLYHAGHIHASRIVRKWPIQAKLVSLTRRLSRFLDNRAVRVRTWYEPVARAWLAACAGGEVRLILDGSKVGRDHHLLMVGLAYRRRAIPLAWTWVAGPRGHSAGAQQLALLAYVRNLLPAGARVLLVGDAEFGQVAVLQQLRHWHWRYVLRSRGNLLVCRYRARTWVRFDSLVRAAGQQAWCRQARFTHKWAYATNLLAHWATGETEPWLLVTNLPSAQLAQQAYRRRMWIEEMFGDMKGHGFDLEATHLLHFLRLSRLTLAVCLLYVWLLITGRRVIKNGQRALVDRADR